MKKFGIWALALGLVGSSFAQEVKEESKHTFLFELDNVVVQKFFDDNDQDNDLIYHALGVTHKYQVNDDYRLDTRVKASLKNTRDTDGDWNLSAKHSNTRVTLVGPTLFSVGNWKYGQEYRYYLPTDSSAQQQGSYGWFQLRTKFSSDLTPRFSFSLRNYFAAYLQRNGYQENGDASVANPLGQYSLGLVGVFTLANNLSLTALVFNDSKVYAEDRVTGDVTWKNTLWHEVELLYTLENLGNLNVGLAYYNETAYGNNGDTNRVFAYEDQNAEIVLRMSKAF